MRGPQSALYGSDAIGGVIQIITRSGGNAVGAGAVRSRQPRHAARARRDHRRRERLPLAGSAPTISRTTASPARPPTARPCRTTMAISRRRRRRSAGVTRKRRRSAGLDPVRRHRSRLTRRRTDRILRNRFGGVDTSRAAPPSASAAASRLMQPWFGASSRVRQRIEFDVADYDLQFKSAFGTSEGNTHRSHARDPDRRVGERGVRLLRRRRVARRKRRQHLHHRRHRRGRDPGRAQACSASSAKPAGTPPIARRFTAGIRGERIKRDALPGDPLAFQPRPDFPEETINSVNPKIAGIVRRSPRRHASARLRSAPASVRRMRSRSPSPTTPA